MGELNYKYVDIKKKLIKLGFVLKRQAKGSHEIWFKDETIIVLPNHGNKTLSKGVVKSIVKKLGLTYNEFRKL